MLESALYSKRRERAVSGNREGLLQDDQDGGLLQKSDKNHVTE